MPLAALLGALSGGVALDTFGRKKTIISTSVPFIVSGVLVYLATNVEMIYAGNVLLSISCH